MVVAGKNMDTHVHRNQEAYLKYNQDFLIVFGDLLFNFDFKKLIDLARNNNFSIFNN